MQNSNVNTDPHRWSRWAGVGTWVLVSYAILLPWSTIAEWHTAKYLSLAAVLFYGGAIFLVTKNGREDGPWFTLRMRVTMLTAMVASLLVLAVLNGVDEQFILMIIFAAILPEYLSIKWSVITLVLIHLLISVAFYVVWPGHMAIVSSLLYLGFEFFALFTSHKAAEERRARTELGFANQQLALTQGLLSETSKQEERLRISRDLHDVMGHHLTGLSLQLEVASHSDPDSAQAHIAKAQAITKLLLADVRQVVSDTRAMGEIDIRAALENLAASCERPEIHLTLPERLSVTNTAIIEVLFRVTQEIITNSVKHSGARHLHISLEQGAAEWVLTARDDQRLSTLPEFGHGLTGMRERVESLGGTLTVSLDPGIHHCIRLPFND